MTWQTKKLGDILKLEYGKPLPRTDRESDGKYAVYGANGIKSRSNIFFYDKPSIIVGRKGSAGEINYTEEKFWPLDVTYYVTYDENKYDLNFIYHLLSLQQLTKLAKGVKPGINRNDVYSITVNIPDSLAEQQRIVKILDEAFKKIDKVKKNAGKNLQNSKNIFESYLQNVFQNSDEKWELRLFGEVCKLIGGSQPSKNVFIYEPKDDYIRLIQVRDYRTDKFVTYIPKKMAKRFCSKDDIMIGRYGPPIFGIFKGLEGTYNVALMKAVPNIKLCIPEYLYWFLKTNDLKVFVEKSSKRAAGQDGVRKELLDKYPVPIAPMNEQPLIVSKINNLLTETKKLESIYQQKLADLDELKKSILNKAFRGDL
jgi:type I restriction enzyme S subunit